MKKLLCVCLLILSSSLCASAATLYWDSDGNSIGNDIATGVNLGGSGTWDTTSPFWFDLANDIIWNNSGADDAIFSGTNGVVSLNEPILAASLYFTNTLGSYTLTNNNLTLTVGTVDTGGGNHTINSLLDGFAGLTKNGGGILTLGNAGNTYSGITVVNEGTISIRTNVSLGFDPGTADAITLNGGTLRTTASFTLESTRGITLGGNGGRVEPTSGTLTYAGNITSAGTPLTKSGAGTWRQTGNSSFSGLVINGGTYRYTSDGSFTTDAPGPLGLYPAATVPDYITISNNGVLRSDKTGVAGSMMGTRRGITLGPGGGTINVSSATAGDLLIYNGIVTGPGETLTKTGPNEIRMAFSHTFSKLIINQGLYRINGTGGLETSLGAVPGSFTADGITINGGALGTSATITLNTNRGVTLGANGGSFVLNAAITIPSAITGPGNLTKAPGPSPASTTVLTLSGANTYTGKTINNIGIISINSDARLGTPPTNFVADAITLSGVNATLRGTATFTLNANRGITIGPGDAIIQQTSGTMTYNGIITGSPTNGIFTKSEDSTLRLGGANNYVATTRLSDGVLSLDRDNCLGTGTLDFFGSRGSLRAATSTERSLTNAIKFTASGLSFGGTGNLILSGDVDLGGSPSIITNNNTATTTFSGALTNVGGFILTSPNPLNTMVLSGENTYSGPTTVNGGRLLVSNIAGSGTGSGSVTVTAGATLGGNGTISGAVSITGGNLAPGNTGATTIGTLTCAGGLTLDSSTHVWELGALKDDSDGIAGLDFDQLNLAGGALSLNSSVISINFANGSLAPDFANPFWQTSRTWTVVKMNGGANSSNFISVQTNTYHYAGTFSTSVEPVSGDILLTFTPSGPTAPIIVSDPQNMIGIEGSNVTFTVVATGTAPLGYQWFYNDNTLIADATNSSLTLSNLEANDAGNYKVVVSNTLDSATSANASLTVIVPPTITGQPQSQTVPEGTNVTFTVTATGTEPFVYQWKFNTTNIVGETNASLTLSNVTTTNAGSYTVLVTNLAGSELSSAAVLTIGGEVGPVITIFKTNQIVTLEWPSIAGRDYRAQYRTNLTATNWVDLVPDVTATGSTSSITNDVGADVERYYQVLLLSQP